MRILALIALLTAQQAAPLPQDSGNVTGQIHAASGVSVSGIRISAMVVPQAGAAGTDSTTLERLTTTDNEGRFRLENIRPGRYYITAGFVDQPTFFPGVLGLTDARVVVVAAGSTLPGIDFELKQSPGVGVKGRLNGVPGNLPAGFIRAVLTPTAPTQRPGQAIEALVLPDGTFQFEKVGPGTYNLRTNPLIVIPPPIIRVEVKDSDVSGIEIAIGPVIVGLVTVADGSPLPSPMTPATAGNPNTFRTLAPANTPSLVQLIAIRPTNPLSPTSFGGIVRTDGVFAVANFQPGEYRIAARLPFGYTIQSMTFQDVDLLKTTLKIPDAASATGTVRLVLTATPPTGTSGGVKVSGRVTGASLPANAWISMQSSSPGIAAEGGIGETMVRPDGTFEFQRVPPGVYSARMLPAQGPAPQIAVIVEDVDVADVAIPNMPPPVPLTGGPPPAFGPPAIPGRPAPLAIQPPSYPAGVTVTGRVATPSGTNLESPRTVVLFGPRDGLSVQAQIRSDGTFEIPNVPEGNYDARTLPLIMPSISTRVVVGDKDVNGVTLNIPGTRATP